MLRNKKIYMMPIIGFLLMILLTTLILKLPICHKSELTSIDALFEAASMVTATGSNVVDVPQKFTWFGQFIMLLAMEIGAIGFMVFFSLLFMVSKKKIRLSDTIFLGNEINTNNYTSIKAKAKKIIRYTLVIEFFGAWLLAFRFVPMYGVRQGLWYSMFHAVSAFCNVGCDCLGANGFLAFRNDWYVNIVFVVLMFLGSLGFFVLEDLVAWFCSGKRSKIHVESKLILKVSFILVILGIILLKVFDTQLTILEALFSVVTARNTGFYTVDMSSLHEMNQFLISLIMFIGGGPGSNAGGIRVMVFMILILTTVANLRGQEDVVVYYRSIQDKIIKKAITILSIDLWIVFVGMLAISLTENQTVLDTAFYVISTFSNTGLSTIDMESLTTAGKWISILIMYIGRIAPITFVSLFVPMDNKKSGMKYPNMDVML